MVLRIHLVSPSRNFMPVGTRQTNVTQQSTDMPDVVRVACRRREGLVQGSMWHGSRDSPVLDPKYGLNLKLDQTIPELSMVPDPQRKSEGERAESTSRIW